MVERGAAKRTLPSDSTCGAIPQPATAVVPRTAVVCSNARRVSSMVHPVGAAARVLLADSDELHEPLRLHLARIDIALQIESDELHVHAAESAVGDRKGCLRD